MNKLEITQQVLFEVKQHKLNEELKVQQNLKLARQKSKEFAKLETQLKEMQIEIGKLPQNSDKSNELKFELYKLKTHMIKQLNKIGMSINDITPEVNCKKCQDKGTIGSSVCSCIKETVNKKLLKLAGLNENATATFDKADKKILKENKQLNGLFEFAKKFANDFPNIKKNNMVLIGPVGVGKTFILECIANEILKKNYFVIYTTAFNFSNVLLNALAKQQIEQQEIFNSFIDCDMLIIDDLGSELVQKKLSNANLFNVLNERKIKNKSTLISSNLMPEQIDDKYGNRICSRIFDKRNTEAYLVDGKDLRIN